MTREFKQTCIKLSQSSHLLSTLINLHQSLQTFSIKEQGMKIMQLEGMLKLTQVAWALNGCAYAHVQMDHMGPGGYL